MYRLIAHSRFNVLVLHTLLASVKAHDNIISQLK